MQTQSVYWTKLGMESVILNEVWKKHKYGQQFSTDKYCWCKPRSQLRFNTTHIFLSTQNGFFDKDQRTRRRWKTDSSTITSKKGLSVALLALMLACGHVPLTAKTAAQLYPRQHTHFANKLKLKISTVHWWRAPRPQLEKKRNLLRSVMFSQVQSGWILLCWLLQVLSSSVRCSSCSHPHSTLL